MDINMAPVTLNVTDAAKLLGVSRPTLYQMMQRKDFPSFKIGGRVLIDYDSLKEWSRKQVENKGMSL